ncbi:hypothetical protein RM190_21090 [Paracoccus sp. CPCC 101403]|uniref:Uncharacterized protein n=1 Tax=Paracoccus broussonetiae TaxID=3075834 RepID=A0ABU3ELQ4_9RHOB|nr:hypothetical protein [Paracoccus sp. CPCC 101403]
MLTLADASGAPSDLTGHYLVWAGESQDVEQRRPLHLSRDQLLSFETHQQAMDKYHENRTAEEASKAYKKAAEHLFGEFARAS